MCKPGLKFINLLLKMNALSCGPDAHIHLTEHAFAPSVAATGEVKVSEHCLVSMESIQEELAL